jgi:hypothetical protein
MYSRSDVHGGKNDSGVAWDTMGEAHTGAVCVDPAGISALLEECPHTCLLVVPALSETQIRVSGLTASERMSSRPMAAF